jgi:hypothetical protein
VRITAVRDVGEINMRLGVSGGISHSIKIVIMLVLLFFVRGLCFGTKFVRKKKGRKNGMRENNSKFRKSR